MDRLLRLSLNEQGKALMVAFLFSLVLCLGVQASLVTDSIIALRIP